MNVNHRREAVQKLKVCKHDLNPRRSQVPEIHEVCKIAS